MKQFTSAEVAAATENFSEKVALLAREDLVLCMQVTHVVPR